MRRLSVVQIAILIATTLFAVTTTWVLTDQIRDTQSRAARLADAQAELVGARDELRAEATDYWRARSEGDRTIDPRSIVVVAQASLTIKRLAGLESVRPAGAGPAITVTLEGLEQLQALLRQNVPTVPTGAVGRAADRRLVELSDQLETGLAAWIGAQGAQLDAARADTRHTVDMLSIVLAAVLTVVLALGVIGWVLLDRVRSRVEGELASERDAHAGLRRIATAVASDPEGPDLLDRIAAEAAGLLRADLVAVTGGADGDPEIVGLASGDGSAGSLVPLALSTARAPWAERLRRPEDGPVARGVPIRVRDGVWGALVGVWQSPEAMPAEAEETLAEVGEIVAVAVLGSESRASLRRTARTDPLTEVANRRAFQERLEEEVGRARDDGDPLSLVIFDIDHFKRINDTRGHQVGDEVLREFTARLEHETRGDDLLARIGGEEFAWLLARTCSEEAASAAERALEAVASEPFAAVGAVSTSAGVCDLEASDGTAEGLLRAADDALYRAKAGGRGRVVRFDGTRVDRPAE